MSVVQWTTPTKTIVVTNDVDTTTEIYFEESATIEIATPDTWTPCTITVWGYDPATDSFRIKQKQDQTGDVTVSAPAERCIPLPDDVFSSKRIKLVSDEADNNEISLGLTLK